MNITWFLLSIPFLSISVARTSVNNVEPQDTDHATSRGSWKDSNGPVSTPPVQLSVPIRTLSSVTPDLGLSPAKPASGVSASTGDVSAPTPTTEVTAVTPLSDSNTTLYPLSISSESPINSLKQSAKKAIVVIFYNGNSHNIKNFVSQASRFFSSDKDGSNVSTVDISETGDVDPSFKNLLLGRTVDETPLLSIFCLGEEPQEQKLILTSRALKDHGFAVVVVTDYEYLGQVARDIPSTPEYVLSIYGNRSVTSYTGVLSKINDALPTPAKCGTVTRVPGDCISVPDRTGVCERATILQRSFEPPKAGINGRMGASCNQQGLPDVDIESCPCEEREQKCVSVLDVVLLLDASGSIGFPNWTDYVLPFVKEAAAQLKLSSNEVHLGLVSFDHHNFMIVELMEGISRDKFIDKVDKKLKYTSGMTDIGAALDFVRKRSFRQGQSRANVPKVIILVTDGVSTDFILNPVRQLEKEGIYRIVIGVGKGTYPSQLELIAGDKKNVLKAEGFDSLARITSKISKQICDSLPIDAVCKLNEFGPCSQSCGTGIQAREILTIKPAERGYTCQQQYPMTDFVRPCTNKLCPVDAGCQKSILGPCDALCGVGKRSYSSSDVTPAMYNGKGCLEQGFSVAEPVTCYAEDPCGPPLTSWFTQGVCKCSKFGQPVRIDIKVPRKRRYASRPLYRVVKCQDPDIECGTKDDCPEWSAWTECTKKCDGGTRQRTRIVPSGKTHCPAKIEQPCNIINCNEFHPDKGTCEYSSWSACSEECGEKGIRMRYRSKDCPKPVDTEPCNKYPCVFVPRQTSSTAAPDTSTVSPETSTASPETSTASPETSTASPETSTASPEAGKETRTEKDQEKGPKTNLSVPLIASGAIGLALLASGGGYYAYKRLGGSVTPTDIATESLDVEAERDEQEVAVDIDPGSSFWQE